MRSSRRTFEVASSWEDGDVLVRLPARDAAWPATLPPVPAGGQLTVTLGHPRLLPRTLEDLALAGYRIVGTAPETRPIGSVVDVLVPRRVRRRHPAWWSSVAAAAERVFDLRLGPVQQVLAAELELHRRALAEQVLPA